VARSQAYLGGNKKQLHAYRRRLAASASKLPATSQFRFEP